MRRGIWIVSLGLMLAPVLGGAQQGLPVTQPGAGGSGTTGTLNHPPRLGDGVGDIPASTQERMGIARMNERQRLLISDTDKLVELVLALKKDVDKTDKNMLSLDVVKRAEAIEKLARSVKEREKGTK